MSREMTTASLLRLLARGLSACAPFLLLCALCGAAGRADAEPAIQWRSLKHVQTAIGITNYMWDGDSICFSNAQTQLRFYSGRRKAEVNGTVFWLNAPAEGIATDGSWKLAGVDLDFLRLAILPRKEGGAKPLRVLLDPGHGGTDEGASSKSPAIKEKDLTLALAKRIGTHLKKAGLHVDYTRTNDVTLALDERSRIARKKKVDLFISIHANHAASAEACGVETYVLPPSGYPGTAEGSRTRGWQVGNRNDYHNTLLGFSIHKNLAAPTNAVDRGLKRQSFFVLRETSCPAVLLEFGFLSNTAEAKRMLRTDWQERSAKAVATGILTYAKKVDALDLAVAEKRKQDAEANERWRLHLAAQEKEKRAAKAPPPAAPVPVPAPAPAPANTATNKTKAAPPKLDSIFEFYAPEKEP